MTTFEITMQAVGWIGLVLILIGVRKKSRLPRQLFMATGAGLLGIMAYFPEPFWIFVVLQATTATVGYLNISDSFQKLKKLVLAVGVIAGITLALNQDTSLITYIGIVGLIGIATGYGALPEPKGHQFMLLGIGASFMVIFSLIEGLGGSIQAWPFFVLNIPFTYWSLQRVLTK